MVRPAWPNGFPMNFSSGSSQVASSGKLLFIFSISLSEVFSPGQASPRPATPGFWAQIMPGKELQQNMHFTAGVITGEGPWETKGRELNHLACIMQGLWCKQSWASQQRSYIACESQIGKPFLGKARLWGFVFPPIAAGAMIPKMPTQVALKAPLGLWYLHSTFLPEQMLYGFLPSPHIFIFSFLLA